VANISRRSSTYYFRRKVPLDLLQHYFPRKELILSLHTKDRREALAMAARCTVESDIQFMQARQQALAGSAQQQFPALQQLQQALYSNISIPAQPSPLHTLSPAPAVQGLQPSQKRDTSLEKVFHKWCAESPKPKRTESLYNSVVKNFIASSGIANTVSIRKQHVVMYKDWLVKERKSPSTINQRIANLRTLLRFACDQDIIEKDPTIGVRVKDTSLAVDKRNPFTVTELNMIFSSPVYTEGYRTKGGGGEAAYWLPLLALFQGARLNELCQLMVSDFRREEYEFDASLRMTWVMNITDQGEGQHLKNTTSQRRIPLHPKLIRFGFIEYLQKQTGPRLFPDLHSASFDGSLSAGWSKWFARYLDNVVGLKDRKLSFHSFRHTFKEFAHYNNIRKEVSNAIQGHSERDMSSVYGRKLYPLPPLVAAMEAFTIPGQNLAHLYRT